MGLDGNPPRKCTPARVKNCLKTFLVHLFSHVGLCVLVVGYAVIGGFIFKELEHRTEEEDKMEAEMADAELNETRRQHVSNLWVITGKLNLTLLCIRLDWHGEGGSNSLLPLSSIPDLEGWSQSWNLFLQIFIEKDKREKGKLI